MPTVIWVILAGALGVVCRYTAGKCLGTAPWPTFFVNLSGCLLIGIVYAVFLEASTKDAASGDSRTVWGIALATGFLGGFTTFSSYSLESLLLWEGGRRTLALSYAVLSPILGIATAALGLTVGRFIFSR